MTKTVNPFDAIAKPKTPAAKASSIPMVAAPEAIHKSVVDWIAAKEALTNAEATMKNAESKILPIAEQMRLSASQSKGEAVTSLRLEAGDSVVTVTTKDAYSAIDPLNVPLLEKSFAKYDEYFASQQTITVKKGADLNALAALVGPARLQEFFDVSTVIKPTSKFHEDRSVNPAVAAKVEPLLDTVIRPYKAGIAVYRKGTLIVVE